MRRALALAIAALAALPTSASAGTVTTAVFKSEFASAPSAAGGCGKTSSGFSCGLYSGAKLTLTGLVYASDGFTPLPAGWKLRLGAYDLRTGKRTAWVKSLTLDGTRVSYQLVIVPRLSTGYELSAFAPTASLGGHGKPVVAHVLARILPQSKVFQRGSTFTLKGRVAFISGFGGGTLQLQACRRQHSTTYCSDKKRFTDSHWGSPLYAKRFAKAGRFATSVKLGSAGVWYYRFRFLPKNGRNATSIYWFYITVTVGRGRH